MEKTKQNKIYLIGNAHIDPVWLWQWQEGYSEIKATFRSALDRMDEFDDFVFVCAGAGYYKWVEENNPEMFREIQKRVKQGRWKLMSGWWVQPDCNVPCGESFARHSLYSQRYYQEKFGVTCETGYNVDSFGHNYMIPQLLVKSGMKNYVYMRPSNEPADLPLPLFLWESPDGSRVLAFRILDDHYNNAFDSLSEVIDKTAKNEGLNTDSVMLFFGVGNHGGGPTIKALEIVKEKQKELGDDMLVVSNPNEYFSDMRKENKAFPIFKKDIQHFASGCYATHFDFKKKHRHVEQLLLATERWNLLAQQIMGYTNESEKLKTAWETVMFNQFHDIMGGCSIQDALKDAESALGYAEHITSDVLNGTLQTFSWAIDTSRSGAKRSKEKSGRVWDYGDCGVPLVVFNPLPFPVQAPIFLDLVPQSIETSDGKDVIMQETSGRFVFKNKSRGTIFTAELPALGYNTYWLHAADKKNTDTTEEEISQRNVLENEWTKLTIDKNTGLIASLYDKTNNIEIIEKPSARALVIDESETDTWGNGFDTFNDIIGEFELKSIALIEDGPVRSAIRVNYTYNNSLLRQDFRLYANSPDVDVDVRVNWQEKNKILKLAFDVNVKYPLATYSCPYGHIVKPCDGKEEPAQMWMDLSGSMNGSSQGLALACNARYSYSALNNSMRLNVVRSPVFAEYNSKEARSEEFEYMDQGIHTLSYKLISHKGDWRTPGVIQKALSLNNPAQKVHETYHKGPLPLSSQYIDISSPQIVLTVLKRPEGKASGIVARLYETFGSAAKTRVKLPAFNVDIELSFTAFEIKTILIAPDGSFEEILLTEL